ncbi:NAD(P)-dependent oxidoreductase [Candidimonas sp. SYP-B2681]|uniref:NAD-dependent epimerase/dehydratase family protein n=1 Tax=Candidimonas sp. SYP-B2681 TaxID=2497686 RepID=UPI000F871DA3|nr:NAD(P)-dependent oxidoreductase [Candidimonas sp. SYP-B2681]RTZ47842.1 NAD(P)-dependent oxidoreductase [Candidimonas sp. SYP-B2681]
MMSLKTVLVTGAAGQLGKLLRESLRGKVRALRLSDIAVMDPANEGEELWPCDLTDVDGVRQMMVGVDCVVHLGASLNVDDWNETLQVNIAGTYNIFEAAKRAGVGRIVYASSHHAVGMYPVDEPLDQNVPLRPDSLYGLSKCFGENTARYFWDKFGLEAVCLRIGSTRSKPTEPRELSTWLSEPDFQALVYACLSAKAVEFSVVYGVSNNSDSWWNNTHATHLNYVPRDNAAHYQAEIESLVASGKSVGHYALQGGKRADYGMVVLQNEPSNS